MSVLTTTSASRPARATTRRSGHPVELLADWKQAVAAWGVVDPSTPFQHPQWLERWYGAFSDAPGIVPLIAVISDAVTGERTALLPLILRRHEGIRIVEFADLGGRPNPLAMLREAGPCALNGNLIVIGEDFDAWRFTLERTTRKELERSWRVFTRDPAAGFRLATDTDAALQILAATEVQQGARMQSLGLAFMLNEERCAGFYRSLVRDGVAGGYAVASALTAGDEIVATLIGIRTGSRYVMIRISNAGGEWSKCSPGRLIIERTMAALHADGVREFDFSIGNYAYKRRFGITRTALADVSAVLSWRGLPYALRDRAARALRRHPRVMAHLKRALGKPPSREED